MPKRIPIFIVVNILMVFATAIALTTIGVVRNGARGSLQVGDLVVFSIIWGIAGAFVWLQMSRWMIRRSVEASQRELKKAKDAVNTLVRLQIAQGLAPLFLGRSRPYEQNAEVSAMLQDGVLHKASFVQKPPFLLNFYRRLLLAFDRTPQSILEIGVKGGGSTALWKAIFPAAQVVGMDLKLRRWLASSGDGVIYVEGDQADRARLEQIAAEYGPFDIVIDDGSHISSDQATTMRGLLSHVRPGGFYIVEDTHASLKTVDDDHKVDYGADIWTDFVVAMFERRRNRLLQSSAKAGTLLASEAAPFVDDLIVGTRVLALRIATPGSYREPAVHRQHEPA